MAMALGACAGSSSREARPVPTLAESASAQRSFQDIHRRWLLGNAAQRLELERDLERFLGQHGEDDRARLVRVYLGWIHLQHGRLELARQFVAPIRRGPPGAVHDFADVIEAAILLRENEPARALGLLKPLDGKINDAQQRLVYGEQLVLAHLALRNWAEAVGAMLDWTAEAAAADRSWVQSVVVDLVAQIPRAALERELLRMDEQAALLHESRTRAPARRWLQDQLRQRLARLALDQSDAELAQRLVSGSGSLARFGDAAEALTRLASEGGVAPRVAGRSVGLVLDLRSGETRRRSAEVAAGMSRALRAASPDPEAGVRLLMRDDGGEGGSVSEALAELSGAGAAILVGGVDRDGADELVRFAEQQAIPTLILSEPRAERLPPFAFVLGESAARAQRVLEAALEQRGLSPIASVGAADGACAAPPKAAGLPRFPVQRWKAERIEGLHLLGDRSCARDVLAELAAARQRPVVALGLECADIAGSTGQREVSIAAGQFPGGDAVRGKSWFEALGHDAAVLTAVALRRFPLEAAQDPEAVRQLHRLARAQLLSSEADLWSTDRRGFAGTQRITRALRVESFGEGPAGR